MQKLITRYLPEDELYKAECFKSHENYFKVDDVLIKEALENYLPNMNRSQLVKTSRNTILLDAYNANPNSMSAAIENFANYKSEKSLRIHQKTT